MYSIIIIIIVTTVIFSSFAVLLNYLYLNPRVLLFSASLHHPTGGGTGRSEQVAVWCLVAVWG